MAKTSITEETKAQMVKEALDTVLVINITEEDFIIHNDRQRPTRTKWEIPNKNRDLGKGKGKQHVPAFIGWRYLKLVQNKVITEISKKDWDEKKDKYRDEERSKYEEKLAIRTDNDKLREELTKKLWGGIVERYGGDDIFEPEVDAPKASSRQNMKEYLKEIGLSNKLVDKAQDDFIKEIE
ncbi:MAG: hypothetical protein GY861_03195 [bacterium]|nr:hypothetical protein [bacterium]